MSRRLLAWGAGAALAAAVSAWAPSARACVVNSDCPASAPLCDPTSGGGVCAPCNSLLDCTLHLGLPICVLSGPLEGQCVACVDVLDCGGTTPICDITIGVCIGCSADNDCGGATSGLVCNVATGACENGCRASGGNACPTGDKCTSSGTAIGVCTLPDGGPIETDGGASDGGDGGAAKDGGETDGSVGDGGDGGTAKDGGETDGSVGDGGSGRSDGGVGDGGHAGDGGLADGSGGDSSTEDGSAGDGGGSGTGEDGSSGTTSDGAAGAEGADNDGGGYLGGYVDGGGCSCNAGPDEGGGAGALMALLGVVVLGARSRRRGGRAR